MSDFRKTMYLVFKRQIEMGYHQNGHGSKLFAEFFAGIGLMRLGLEKAGWKIAFANDIDPTKESIYCKHFDDLEINWNTRELPNLPKNNSRLVDIVEEIPETSKDWWNTDRVEYLLNQTFDRHRVLIETAKKESEYTYFTAFRRAREGRSMAEIRSDGIAGCLRTPKGGSARQILLRTGKGKIDIRLLSPRECARLMGADNYHISGNINQALP